MSWCDMQADLAILWNSLRKQTYLKIETKLMKSCTIADRYKIKPQMHLLIQSSWFFYILKYKSIDIQTIFGDQ